MILSLYRFVGRLLEPLIVAYLQRRARHGKEDGARLGERLGFASLNRPAGPLVWVHAASLGEAMSILPLVGRLRTARPDLSVLVSTGTVASAEVLATALPDGAFHQYAPVDLARAVDRFVQHWRPDLVLWTESEFWPALIDSVGRTGAPMILLNGRISARSARRWEYARGLIGRILSHFRICLAASEEDAARLRRLGAPSVEAAGNLKFAAPPLAADPAELNRLAAEFGRRPRWLAASTHPGDEDAILTAHRWLAERVPDLLTVIAPRHPRRGEDLASHCLRQGLLVARRSQQQRPDPSVAVYVADTIGEMGLWYRLCPVTFIGGSLGPDGGHNPLEPARLGCAILSGPNVASFAEIYPAMHGFGAARTVEDEEDLTEQLSALLFEEPGLAKAMGAAAREFAENRSPALNLVMERIEPLLPLRRDTGHSSG